MTSVLALLVTVEVLSHKLLFNTTRAPLLSKVDFTLSYRVVSEVSDEDRG